MTKSIGLILFHVQRTKTLSSPFRFLKCKHECLIIVKSSRSLLQAFWRRFQETVEILLTYALPHQYYIHIYINNSSTCCTSIPVNLKKTSLWLAVQLIPNHFLVKCWYLLLFAQSSKFYALSFDDAVDNSRSYSQSICSQ